jgi:hypothetical protein
MALLELEKDIKIAVNARLEPLPANDVSDQIWTKEVFYAVAEYGRAHGLRTCYAGGHDEGDCPEWLFDLVLYQDQRRQLFSKERPRRLKRLILVGECEWNMQLDAQIYDFERLMIARADYRLFVFQLYTSSEVRERVRRLKSLVQAFSQSVSGDRYLFGGYAHDQKKMLWYSYQHTGKCS